MNFENSLKNNTKIHLFFQQPWLVLLECGVTFPWLSRRMWLDNCKTLVFDMVHLSFIKVHAWVPVAFKHAGINEKQWELHSKCCSSIPIAAPKWCPSYALFSHTLPLPNLCEEHQRSHHNRLFFLFLFYRPAPLSHQHLGAQAAIKGRSLLDQGFQ